MAMAWFDTYPPKDTPGFMTDLNTTDIAITYGRHAPAWLVFFYSSELLRQGNKPVAAQVGSQFFVQREVGIPIWCWCYGAMERVLTGNREKLDQLT